MIPRIKAPGVFENKLVYVPEPTDSGSRPAWRRERCDRRNMSRLKHGLLIAILMEAFKIVVSRYYKFCVLGYRANEDQEQ